VCRLQIRKHQSKAAEEPVGYGISESSTKWLADRLRSRRLRGYQPGASNGRFVRQHPLTMEVRFWPVLRHSNSDQATAPVWNIGAIGAGQCCHCPYGPNARNLRLRGSLRQLFYAN